MNVPLSRLPIRQAAKILYSKHSDLELLLDSCLLDFQAVENEIQLLERRLASAENMASLRLDSSRNELLVATTVISGERRPPSFSP